MYDASLHLNHRRLRHTTGEAPLRGSVQRLPGVHDHSRLIVHFHARIS